MRVGRDVIGFFERAGDAPARMHAVLKAYVRRRREHREAEDPS